MDGKPIICISGIDLCHKFTRWAELHKWQGFFPLKTWKLKSAASQNCKKLIFLKQHYKVLSNDYTKLFNDNTFPASLSQRSLVVFLIKGSILAYWPSMETFCVILEEVLHHNVTLEEIIPTLKEKWVGQWLVEAWACPSAISLRSPLLCVNSWIEARSERSDDITVSWTFWTLVVSKAKTPVIFRSFPVTRTASHPPQIYSVLTR